MKKLLVLALVLSMATMASATLQLTVSATTTTPGGIVQVGVYTDALIGYQAGTYYVVAIDTQDGYVDHLTGTVVSTDSGMSMLQDGQAQSQGFTIPAGMDGLGGGAFCMDATGGIAAMTSLFSSIAATINATTNVVLYESPDGAEWTVSSSQLVTVPEPITVALLGLGGLFLRRRK